MRRLRGGGAARSKARASQKSQTSKRLRARTEKEAEDEELAVVADGGRGNGPAVGEVLFELLHRACLVLAQHGTWSLRAPA